MASRPCVFRLINVTNSWPLRSSDSRSAEQKRVVQLNAIEKHREAKIEVTKEIEASAKGL